MKGVASFNLVHTVQLKSVRVRSRSVGALIEPARVDPKNSRGYHMACSIYQAAPLTGWINTLFGKTCATTQKNVKSHVFLDFEKNVKKRKKTYI